MLQVFEPFVPKSKSGAFVTLLRSVAVYDETSQTWRRRLDNQTAAQLFDQPTLSLVSVPMSVAATAMAPEMPGVLATAMAHPIPAVWATVSELRASSSSYELNEVNTNLEFPVVQEFMIASPTMMTAPSDLRAASESRAPTQNLNEHDPRQEIKRTHSG